MIHTCSLQSGSNGNSIYVETPDARLLFDAGISGHKAYQRLNQHGRDINEIDAVIISHNHTDHIGHAGVFQRRFSLPLYITAGAFDAGKGRLGVLSDIRHFQPGQTLNFAHTTVQTIPTAHDGIDSVAFVICYQGKKLGIFTDLGHCFDGIDGWLNDLDGLYLESNYDPQMLDDGPYPPWLKQRIKGIGGHISNNEAAQLVNDFTTDLQLLILAHLSEHNNHPNIAKSTAQNLLGNYFPISVASRMEVSEMFNIK